MLDKFIIQMDSNNPEEKKVIEEMMIYQPLVEEIFTDAEKLIKETLGYEIELEPEHTSGIHKGTKEGLLLIPNYMKESTLGRYHWKGSIELNINDVKPYYEYLQGSKELNKIEAGLQHNYLLRTMVHEIGHRIHDIHFNYKTVRLPRQGRTQYSEKNSKENFAEAFENLIMDQKKERYQVRSTALKRVLDLKFDPQSVEVAAKNTIPAKRKTLITLDQICEEIGMTTKSARVKLRKSGQFTKGEAGWAWKSDDSELEIVKNYLRGGRK